jgi:hypothetical protein
MHAPNYFDNLDATILLIFKYSSLNKPNLSQAKQTKLLYENKINCCLEILRGIFEGSFEIISSIDIKHGHN